MVTPWCGAQCRGRALDRYAWFSKGGGAARRTRRYRAPGTRRSHGYGVIAPQLQLE